MYQQVKDKLAAHSNTEQFGQKTYLLSKVSLIPLQCTLLTVKE